MRNKVFISHAKEDKPRFVLKFCERLLAEGIDTWVDEWEILPGDIVIDKIFNEGLKKSKVVVIVVSDISNKKAWVREELNYSVVKKISGDVKIIPVIIDDCEVPAPLESLAWVRINNLDNYENEFVRIAASILGKTIKPPLAKVNEFVPPEESPLSPIDSKVLNEIGQAAINNSCEIITDDSARKHLSDLSDDLYQESLETLESDRLIKIHSLPGSAGPYVTLTPLGFELYGKLFIADYAGLITKIECALVNSKIESNHKLAEFVAEDQFVVDQILELMCDNKLVKLARHAGGHAWIMEVSSKIRRKYG
jgi:hypothetical protein